MTTTLGFKDIIDVPKWRAEAPALAASAAGMAFAWDNRNTDISGNPYLYLLRSASALDYYDPTTGEWRALATPGLAGTFGAGATAVFHPSQGPRGTLAAGGTTTSVVLSTALPAAVGVNQLANRGDGTGFRITVLNNVTGKLETRTIVANTAGTTPTIYVDPAVPFTAAPNLNDGYEIRAGRLFMLSAGTLAAGCWKYYDVATNSYSGNLATTNLPATIGTDSNAVALSESYVSNDRKPNEGFINGGGTYDTGGVSKNCIQATAASSTTLTGSGMPATLAASEYRNFQVRIVEDTTTPTAVGQRSRIASHTGGATGVFTVAAFGVTPSANAKFVVENDDDKILLRSSATTSVYTYNITANTWDTSTFTAAGSACGAGVVVEQGFGPVRDITGNHRHSFIYHFRGGGSASIDVLDIAGGANGAWSADIAYANKSQTFTTGTCGAYAPATFDGRFIHLCINGTQRMARFDVRNRRLDAGAYLRFPQGTALVGQKLAIATFIDGSTKLDFLYHLTNSQTQMLSMAVNR